MVTKWHILVQDFFASFTTDGVRCCIPPRWDLRTVHHASFLLGCHWEVIYPIDVPPIVLSLNQGVTKVLLSVTCHQTTLSCYPFGYDCYWVVNCNAITGLPSTRLLSSCHHRDVSELSGCHLTGCNWVVTYQAVMKYPALRLTLRGLKDMAHNAITVLSDTGVSWKSTNHWQV